MGGRDWGAGESWKIKQLRLLTKTNQTWRQEVEKEFPQIFPINIFLLDFDLRNACLPSTTDLTKFSFICTGTEEEKEVRNLWGPILLGAFIHMPF